MLDIEIDGKQIQVEDGATIMDAAAVAGVYIPHFCYHKKLSIAANCRMCLVQVEKSRKPLPACATPVTNGMKVWTHSDDAVTAQKGVMEFLLVNHPLDCPICDQGGECQLQDLAVGYGGSHSVFGEEKRVVPNKDLGSLVSTDMTRCINCTRCVRFTQEIAGFMELGQAFRGEHAEIMPFVEKTVDSEISGNIIDLCPVGALTSKPFRFSARTWEMSRRKSVAPHDSLGSNLIVQTKWDQVKRVLPFENEEVNECWLSDRDRFSYEALHSEERLTKPMVKTDGQWREVDWQTALEQAATRLKRTVASAGADAVGTLASPQATVEELYLAQKLTRALGSDNVDFRLRDADFRADGHRQGYPWLGMSVADTAKLDRLLVVGSSLRKDVPLLAQRVRQAVRHGLQLNVVHAVAEDWATKVAHRQTVRPSAFVATLAAVLKAVCEIKSVTADEDVAGLLVEVSVTDEARAIAESLCSGQKVAVWLGALATQQGNASDVLRVAAALAKALGAVYGVIGSGANAVGGYVADAVPEAGGCDARAMLAELRQAYLLVGVEPSLDCADGVRAMNALAKADSVIALSAFKSADLLEVADVLLPTAPFSETSGSYINMEGRVQSFHAVCKPAGETRPGWKILRVLGNLLELAGFGYESSQEVLKDAVPVDLSAKLDNAVSGMATVQLPAAGGLERVGLLPIYGVDPLVRRAPALQATADARVAPVRASSRVLASLGLSDGGKARLKCGDGSVEVTVSVDDDVADGALLVMGALPLTWKLGPLCGEISVERL